MRVANDHGQSAMQPTLAMGVELGGGADLAIGLVHQHHMLRGIVHGLPLAQPPRPSGGANWPILGHPATGSAPP